MNTCKSIRFGFAAAAVVLTSAATVSKAADVAPDARPYYLWSGFYAGAHVGAGWFQSGDLSTDSHFLGGGQVGYNWQNNRWVYGVEGDVSGSSMPGLDWTATLTARLGYEFSPRWLVFGKFGAGWIHTSVGDFDATTSSAVFGVGAEYAFANRWSAKLEYNFFDLGSNNFGTSSFQAIKAGVNYKFGPGWPF